MTTKSTTTATTMDPPYTGGCQCGALRYAFTNPPVYISLCHCTACQRENGATHTFSHIIPASSFSVVTPTPTTTTTADPSASPSPPSSAETTYTRPSDAGNRVTTHFCRVCGTTCYATSTIGDEKGVLSIRAGTLDRLALNEGWKPNSELYCRARYGWFATVKGGEGMVEGADAFVEMVGAKDVENVRG